MADNDNLWDYDAATPANNDNIGGNDIAELNLPSTINNALRELTAQNKAYLLDMAGKNTVGGTGDAITITTNQTFTAYADGQEFSFIASADNTGAATINVDGVGAKDLEKVKDAGFAALDAKNIFEGGLYAVRYQSSDDKFILRNPEGFEAGSVGTNDLADNSVSSDKKTAATIAKDEGFKTVALLLADTVLAAADFTTGDIIKAQGFRYEVVTSGEDITNSHATTPVKLKVLQADDGTWPLEAYGDTSGSSSQTVFAAAASSVGSGIIKCSRSTYNTDGTIDIPSNIQFVGLGNGASGFASNIIYSGSGKAVTYEAPTSGSYRRWGGISGFTIECSTTSTDVLYVKGGWNGIFNDLTLDANSNATFALRLQAENGFGTYYNTFNKVVGIGATTANLEVDGDTDSSARRANANRFISCNFDNGDGIGARLAGCDTIDFYAANIEANTGTGLVVGVSGRTAPTRVNFFGGYIENGSATYDVDATEASTGGNGGVNFYGTRMSSAKVRSGSICQFFGNQDNGKYTATASSEIEQITVAGESQASRVTDGRGRFAYEIGGTTSAFLTAKSNGDADNRIEIENGGAIKWGDGTNPPDVELLREGSGLLATPDQFQVARGTAAASLYTKAFRIGGYYLWPDSSGVLRIKSSAPSSETDGTVVGTQT